MYKKTLISLAVASSLMVTGCFEDSRDSKNDGTTLNVSTATEFAAFKAQFEGKTFPVFNPVAGRVPIPSDLNFDSDAADGSFGVPNTAPPVTAALNRLSGASTVAQIDLEFNGRLDATTVVGPVLASGDANPGAPVIQSVYMLELGYASGAPVQALSLGEAPGAGTGLFNDFIATVEEFKNASGTVTDYIRITPTAPLNPNRRYIAVITTDVKTVDGDAISPSPDYANLRGDRTIIGNLQPVRQLVNFWENVVVGVSNANAPASLNAGREQAGRDPISSETIALSYSFTTSNDKQVLSYIANPALWLRDQIETSVKVGAVASLTSDERRDPLTVGQTVGGALANFTPSVVFNNPGLEPCDDADGDGNYVVGPPVDETFTDQFNCVGTLTKLGLNAGGITFEEPSARNLDITSTEDAVLTSVILGNFVEPGDIRVHQGFINLPYYLGVPSDTDGSPIRTSSWSVNSDLAAAISGATGIAIPQANPSQSTVLNYNFPFAKTQAEIDVPLLVMTSGAVSADDLLDAENPRVPALPVAIFQHGINTDRSAALAYGAQLIDSYKAATGGGELVVVAIDQPLHGISPVSRDDRLELAGTLLAGAEAEAGAPAGSINTEDNRIAVVDGDLPTVEDALNGDTATASAFISTNTRAGSTIPGLSPTFEGSGVNMEDTSEGAVNITERHFGFSANAQNAPAVMNFDEDAAFGSSGSLFINLTDFINNRDGLRQGAVDLMNLRATLESAPGIDGDQVYFIGHSLGTLNGAAFVAASTASGREDLHLAGSHLLTPVAGIVRLLENSPSFAPTILGGLNAVAGLSQGDANLETYFNVNQAALDTVDPINFANELATSNVLLSQINADRTTPNAAFVGFNDAVDGFDVGPLDVALPNGFVIQSSFAPLSGSEALAKMMDANNTGVGAPKELASMTRYLEGVHGTPVLPLASTARAQSATGFDFLKNRDIADGGEVIVSQDDAANVFGEMIAQTIQLLTSPESPKEITGGGFEPGVIQPD